MPLVELSTLANLRVVLDGAVSATEWDIGVVYEDLDDGFNLVQTTAGSSQLWTSTAGVTKTTVAGPPTGNAKRRRIMGVTVTNRDTSKAVITIWHEASAVERWLLVKEVPAGATLYWLPNTGWQVSTT